LIEVLQDKDLLHTIVNLKRDDLLTTNQGATGSNPVGRTIYFFEAWMSYWQYSVRIILILKA